MNYSQNNQLSLLSIQILRGIAALLVVVHHAITFHNQKYKSEIVEFNIGAIGVDIFFVISGFIMFWTTQNHKPSLNNAVFFLKKRIFRIAPLYWFVTMLYTIIWMVFYSNSSVVKVNEVFLIKSLFFIPYFNSFGDIHPLIDQGWTLNFEMYFYIIFGVTLIFYDNLRAAFFCTSILILTIISGFIFHPNSSIFITYTSPLLLEFCIGLLCGYCYKTYKGFGIVISILLLLISFLFLSCVFYDFPTNNLLRALVWGGFSGIILYSLISLENLFLKSNAIYIPLLIGDASYSIYLVHVIFFAILYKFSMLFNLISVNIYIYIVGSVFFGILVYFSIEKVLGRIFDFRHSSQIR